MQSISVVARFFLFACCSIMVIGSQVVSGVELKPGDILADMIVVKPGTGTQTIAGVQLYQRDDGMAFDNAGNLLNIFDGAITTQDLDTREQTTVFPNGQLSSILGLVVAADGRIFAYDRTSVSRIDPITGAQTILASGNQFDEIEAIAMDSNGDVLLGDSGNRALFTVDPDSGAVETVSSDGDIFDIAAVQVDGNGDYIVMNQEASAPVRFVKVDRVSGTQSNAVSGELKDAQDIAINIGIGRAYDFVIDANGDFLVARNTPSGPYAGIFRVDPATGLTTSLNDERYVIGDLIKNGDGEVFFTALILDGNGLYSFDPQTGDAEILIYQRISSISVLQASLAAGPDEIYFISNGIKRLIPTTGKVEDIASGGLLSQPQGLVVESDGNLLVLEGSSDSIIRVNPGTGSQSSVASLEVDFGIADIYLGPDGFLYALPTGGLNPQVASSRIIRVDPSNGSTTLMPLTGNFLSQLVALAVEPGGNILVASGSGIYRISASTGSSTLIAQGGNAGILIDRPRDLAVAPDGTIYVADSDARAVVLIDPNSLAQSELSSGGYLPPSGVVGRPQVLALVPGEIISFVGTTLVLPAVEVAPDYYRVEMTLLDPVALTFQVTRGDPITEFDEANLSVFANNVLVIDKVVVGNTAYYVELTLTDPGALIFTLTNAIPL